MEIDIISFSSDQFADLTFSAIKEIRSAQLKKNRLLRQLEKNLKKERNKILKRGIFDSCIWEQTKVKMQADCEVEIEEIRQSLLFYLTYLVSKKGDSEKVPYEIDYALSFAERYVQVRGYYVATYADFNDRFSAFKADAFARTYLGELYGTLYDEFAAQI